MNQFTLLLTLLLVSLAAPSFAQESNDSPTEESSEYHYKDGPYGYRAEVQLMDSLAVLEMTNQITPAEAKEKKDKFRKDKEAKQKQKKDKQRKKRKQKKDKEDKQKS